MSLQYMTMTADIKLVSKANLSLPLFPWDFIIKHEVAGEGRFYCLNNKARAASLMLADIKQNDYPFWQQYVLAPKQSLTSLNHQTAFFFVLHYFVAYHICKLLLLLFFFSFFFSPKGRSNRTEAACFLAPWIVWISISFEISWEELFWISWAPLSLSLPLSLWHSQIRQPAVTETH